MDALHDHPLIALPLAPISPRLPIDAPFTRAMAARAGIGRSVLDRLLREGRVRRLLRGVYLDATVRATVELRARALELVIGSGQVTVGLTAAWLHGVEVPSPRGGCDDVPPIELLGRGRVSSRYAGRPVRYADHDLQTTGGVRATTPLRTALDLGRLLTPDRALAALDALLALGAFTHTTLVAELPRFAGTPGVVQLRELTALADARAASPAESVLRLHWLHGRLPTPAPAHRVALPGGGGARLALALELHQFGAAFSGHLSDPDRAALSSRGWRVVVLGADRVLRGDPAFLVGHLEREFHLHLLGQVG
jgi:hypothetical protein